MEQITREIREPRKESRKEKTEIKEKITEIKGTEIKDKSKEYPSKDYPSIIKNKEYPSIIKNFIGKEIVITLRNGTNLKGKLETVTQYELMVTISVSYTPIIIMKHAIDYVTLGEK